MPKFLDTADLSFMVQDARRRRLGLSKRRESQSEMPL